MNLIIKKNKFTQRNIDIEKIGFRICLCFTLAFVLILTIPWQREARGENENPPTICSKTLMDPKVEPVDQASSMAPSTDSPTRTGLPLTKSSKRSPPQSWEYSIRGLQMITQEVQGRENVVEVLTTIALSNQFAWINGDPGAAKTYLSRLFFNSILNSYGEEGVRAERLFIIQFNKLLSEGKISGFPKFNDMMKSGRYKIETASSLINRQVIYLIADEIEKAHAATKNAFLSILQERKAFHGSAVLVSSLLSGVLLSNKTLGQFVNDAPPRERTALEAFLDRSAVKIHMPNQQSSVIESVNLAQKLEKLFSGDDQRDPTKTIVLPLSDLSPLMNKVRIPISLLRDIEAILKAMDIHLTRKWNISQDDFRHGEEDEDGFPIQEAFPANQFSTRSSIQAILHTFRSALLAHQLMQGVPFEKVRFTPERQDLHLLFLLLQSGPLEVKPKEYPLTVSNSLGKTGILVQSPRGSLISFSASYFPYSDLEEIRIRDGRGSLILTLKRNYRGDFSLEYQNPNFTMWSLDLDLLDEQLPHIEEAIKELKDRETIDPSKIQFEVDSRIMDPILQRGTVPPETVTEWTSIREDADYLVSLLNQQMERQKPPEELEAHHQLTPIPSIQDQRKQAIAFRRKMIQITDPRERTSLAYNWMIQRIKELKRLYLESEHLIESKLTGMLARTHLLIWGPPGAGKTSLASNMSKAEIRRLNDYEMELLIRRILSDPTIRADFKFLRNAIKRLKKHKHFFIQFHPMLPEGAIKGFSKGEKRLEDGLDEIEVQDSLVNREFAYALLDESDRANLGTLEALLAILQERKLFNGDVEISSGLLSADLTINKTLDELLEAHGVYNKSSMKALGARALNKVFAPNKLVSSENLIQLLVDQQDGITPNRWRGTFALHELLPLIDQIHYENPALETFITELAHRFIAKRLKEQTRSYLLHNKNGPTHPNYYVVPSDASDRTIPALKRQLKARFLVHQLMEGISFDELRTQIEIKDIGLFFEGLGHWAPQRVTFSHQDGRLKFISQSGMLEEMIKSQRITKRIEYQIKAMMDEAQDFADIANDLLREFQETYLKEIRSYPDLFPSLFSSPQERERFFTELEKAYQSHEDPNHDGHNSEAPPEESQEPNLPPDVGFAFRRIGELTLHLDEMEAGGSLSSQDPPNFKMSDHSELQSALPAPLAPSIEMQQFLREKLETKKEALVERLKNQIPEEKVNQHIQLTIRKIQKEGAQRWSKAQERRRKEREAIEEEKRKRHNTREVNTDEQPPQSWEQEPSSN